MGNPSPSEDPPQILSTTAPHVTLPAGFLFDMDGTILDSEVLGCKAVYLTLEDKMSEVAKRDFMARDYRMEWPLKQQTLGLPGSKWAAIVLEWARQNWGVAESDLPSVEEFLEQWDQHMSNNMHTVEACKGAKELVEYLASENRMMDGVVLPKLPLAIATSSHSNSVKQKRQRHEDMFQHFAAIVSTDDVAAKNGKPAPDIYLEAARRIGIAANQCVVFEDGMPGVKAGKAAGAFVVAVPDPRFTKEEIEKLFVPHADLVLEEMAQFDWKTLVEAMAKKRERSVSVEQQ
jgi:HAD superfamily hydrolase (TIGR01509 family)